MVKRFSQWRRLLAAFLTLVMLFSNNVGVLEAFAEGEEATTNLELNARVIVNNNDGTVDAGEKFQYELQYTVPNLTGSKYTGAQLKPKLPEYVELEADVDRFELDFTATVFTPGLFSNLDEDTLNDLSEAAGDVNELSDASGKLKDGTKELYDGALHQTTQQNIFLKYTYICALGK